MEIVVTNQYGLIIFAVTVDENGMPKTLYQGINRAEAVSTYQKAIENPANAKKRVRFYNFRQVYDYVGEEKNKSAYPIKEFYDDTEVYQPSNKDNIETIMVNNNHKLLAPNGKVSNLTAEQWHLVRTPEFKDWFGDWLRHPNRSSKVLDANGEPMVMFHGSNNYQYFTNPYPNYTVFFDPRMSRLEPRTEGGGVYFSNKWDVAAQFSIFNFVVECFINIRKPIKIDGDHSHIWYVIGEERINYGKNDGVILYNTYDTLDGETENENYVSDIVIARYSNQIKLADGRNTTFDKNDVDIRFEDGGKTHSSNTPEAKKLQKKHDAEILLAPNGKKSNLTPEQWHLVRTTAFKAWFGDWENNPQEASKVVDENGEPLVCNHSSLENHIDIFYGNRIFRTSKNKVKPIWFTYKEFYEYAQGDEIYQYRCFLNIRKLFDYSNINDVNKLKKYYIYENGEMLPDYDYDMEWSSQEDYNLPAYIYDMGYDGYKFTDEYSVVVFNSNQIKLADGTNTTFDGSNPDIRYADGGKIKIKVHSNRGEEDRTIISIPNVGEAIIAETTPEYEFMEDIDEKTMNKLGVEEGDLIGKLEWIEIKDEYKGQGYATILMKKAIEVAKEKDLMPLYLNASPMGFTGMNTEELTAFYEKFGFKVFKRQGHNNLMILKEQKHEKGGKTTARPYSNLDISRVKKGIVQLHSIHPKRITKIDDLPI